MFLLVGVLLLGSDIRYIAASPDVDDTSLVRQVSFVTNSVLNRTSNIYVPTLVKPGLAAIDLSKLVNNEEELIELRQLYDELQQKDTFYERKFKPRLEPEFQALVNGQWVKCTKNDDGTINVGNTRWRGVQTRLVDDTSVGDTSVGDTMRLDEWVAFTFSTINGGLYYKLLRFEDDLGKTVAKFAGADAAKKVLRQAEVLRNTQPDGKRSIFEIAAANLNDELSKTKVLIFHSNVTGRQRLIVFVFGTAMPPARGVQLVVITYDIAEDNIDPNADPGRNLLKYLKYNGGEAIFHLPNGMLAYVVFDQNDKILASVPDNVAHDREARKVMGNVSTVRVFSGMSCANCHDSIDRNWGWQPVTNIMADALRSNVIFQSKKPHELASAYSATKADLDYMLDTFARLPYQRSVAQATSAKSSKLVVNELAKSYWGYWYKVITPDVALKDFGITLTRPNAQAFLIRHLEPIPLGDELLEEDIILAHLKNDEPITSVQWRALYKHVHKRLHENAKDDPELAAALAGRR